MAKSKAESNPAQDETKSVKGAFMMRPSILKKLKYISLVEDENQYDLVDEALSKYIADYEKKHGEIKLK